MSGKAESKGTLSRVALPAAIAAAGAGIGLLFTTKPRRLRRAIPELPDAVGDLVDDLKERVESLIESGRRQEDGDSGPSDLDRYATRRRERGNRRERRRQQPTR